MKEIIAIIATAIKENEHVGHTFDNQDILGVYKASGDYFNIGRLKHLTLSYGEYDSTLNGYYALQSEYFAADDYEGAAKAFVHRLQNFPNKSSDMGKTLDALSKQAKGE